MEDKTCPECEKEWAIETVWQQCQFPVRRGDKRVELSATLPVKHCKFCNYQFLDHKAQSMQDNYVRAYQAAMQKD